MRYDKEISLINSVQQYNPMKSNYDDIKHVEKALANVTQVSLERVKQLFGDIDHDVLSIRLPNNFLLKEAPSEIEINKQIYKVISQPKRLKGMTFFVEAIN